ncbi:MAG: hypothetical protein WCG26_00435 [Chloroflexales bacterium]
MSTLARTVDPASIAPALVARLRRMTAEPTSTTYDDAALRQCIVDAVVTDRATLARAGGMEGVVDVRYVPQPPQFDLHAAAALIWEEKLAALIGAGTYDLNADGEKFALSQMVTQYEKQIAYHQSRRRVTSVRQIVRRAPGVAETINADITTL